MSGGVQEGSQSDYTMTNVIVTGAYKRNKALLIGQQARSKLGKTAFVTANLRSSVASVGDQKSFSPPPRCVAVQSPAALFSRPPPRRSTRAIDMFSFRRKNQKKLKDHSGPPYIRSSPSLPELSASGIPWPEDLIDAAELPKSPATFHPLQGAPSSPVFV